VIFTSRFLDKRATASCAVMFFFGAAMGVLGLAVTWRGSPRHGVALRQIGGPDLRRGRTMRRGRQGVRGGTGRGPGAAVGMHGGMPQATPCLSTTNYKPWSVTGAHREVPVGAALQDPSFAGPADHHHSVHALPSRSTDESYGGGVVHGCTSFFGSVTKLMNDIGISKRSRNFFHVQ